MNDRWLTLAGAIGTLLVFAALLYTPNQAPSASRPTSVEPGSNGYLGLQTWLTDAGIPTKSLRRRFDQLASDTSLGSTGNVMITTLPYNTPLRSKEIQPLREWTEAGNTLLVLAALNDSPKWIMTADLADFDEDLHSLTGIAFDELEGDEGTVTIGETLETYEYKLLPLEQHPLMSGVEQIAGISDWLSSIWEPRLDTTQDFVMSIAFDAQYRVDALWQIPTGEGQIILSASGSLLANRVLGEADNALFFANLLAWHLGPDGTVLFDDIHHGLSDLYDPEEFFSDERLHNTLLFLLAFWLLYLLGGSSRIAPARETLTASHQSGLVEATGRLMDRKLQRAEAGRAMIDNWLQELRNCGQLAASGSTTPPWDELAALPAIDPGALQTINDSYSRLGRGDKVDLAKLHNTLLAIKRTMA